MTAKKDVAASKRRGFAALGVDKVVRYLGRSWRVRKIEATGAGYQPLDVLLDDGAQMHRCTLAQLIASIYDEVHPSDECPAIEPSRPELPDLPEEERQMYLRRAADLWEIETGSPNGCPDLDREAGVLDPRFDPDLTTKEERIRAKQAQMDQRTEQMGYSRSRLIEQIERLKVGGVEAIVHRNRKRLADPLKGVDPNVLEVLTKFVEVERGGAHIRDREFATKARAALQRSHVGEGIKSKKLKSILGELTRGWRLHYNARQRERHSLKPDKVYGQRRANRPGELIQVDATYASVRVFDPKLGWAPATVLTAIDVYTRCVVALRVVTGRPTSRDVALLLWDISRPTVTRSGWPRHLVYHHGVPKLVEVYGCDLPGRAKKPESADSDSLDMFEKPAVVPCTIVMDHGRENDSLHIKMVALRNGIDIIWCPPRAAHAKGIVESLHNCYRDAQSLLEAFIGEHPHNHPRGADQQATLTAADLQDYLWEYVLTIYHHESHQSLQDMHGLNRSVTPAQMYTAYVESGGWIDLPADPYRFILFLSSKQCLIQEYGLNVENRTYNSPELRPLRFLMQRGMGVPPRSLTVYYDRWDVSRVYVRHPKTGEWLCVPRTGQALSAALPCSELVDRLLHGGRNLPAREALTVDEAERLGASLSNVWTGDAMAEARVERIASIERGRAHTYAHDLENTSPEFQRLAFGDDDLDPSSAGALDDPDPMDDTDDDVEWEVDYEVEEDL